MAHGYIYVRCHSSYGSSCKLGKTINIPERDSQYATGELKRGYFGVVFAVPIEYLDKIERALQSEFALLNIKYDGGTEFYDVKIMDLIEPYFIEYSIQYDKLTPQGIDELKRVYRSTIGKYTPRDYQYDIIDKTVNYLQHNDKGILILTCGIGKTLISLWATQKLNIKTILIGVPNKLLLKQWRDAINIIFDIPILIVSGGINVGDISHFLNYNVNGHIIITTYSSSHKVRKAIGDHVFGINIYDECHHLILDEAQNDDTKKYINILNVASNKQLYLTATPRSTDDIVIDRKCLLWAIDNNIVCDYVIQTIRSSGLPDNLNINLSDHDDKRLFLGAFVSLKSIFDNHSHHILIYSNNKQNSAKLIKYIKMLLLNGYFNGKDLYCSSYHGEMKPSNQKAIIDRFSASKYGIISNVYCLNEGWDFPLLDAVVFAENMTSNIRIVQSALRASRKHKDQPNKITKIILPILNDDWLDNDDNIDFKKVREVIYQMSLEDETIIQKIRVSNIDIKKHHYASPIESIEENYNIELTDKLLLKTMGRTDILITYDKARKIIAGKGLICKGDYYKLNDIRLPKDPESAFKSQFVNWVDYLSIKRVYYELDECKKKVLKYMSEYPELRNNINISSICSKLCEIDPMFPPNGLWVDYYNSKDLGSIIIIQNRRMKK